MTGGEETLDRAVNDTLAWLGRVTRGNGLVSFWPGGRGYVFLSAWSLDLVSEASEAGYTVDPTLKERLVTGLRRAMRSDYGHFIDGGSFAERSDSLEALARAGFFLPSYAAELARRTQYLDLGAAAGVTEAFSRGGGASSETVDRLLERLRHGVLIRLHQGKEIYGGLQEDMTFRNPVIVPSETRTLARIIRAISGARPDDDRLQVLVNGLVRLGRGDGWGSTNANAEALLALSELMSTPRKEAAPSRVVVDLGGHSEQLEIGADRRLAYLESDSEGGGKVRVEAGDTELTVWLESTWMPQSPGPQVGSESHGFVVTREQLLVVGEGVPPERISLDKPGLEVDRQVGQIVEEHVRVVNPADRHYVAISVPLAAGMEPLNPELATAPPEARPAGKNTEQPTYVSFADDRAVFYYDTLAKGTYDLYLRTRATTVGRYSQPAASAEMMYDSAIRGNGCGAQVVVSRPEGANGG